MSWRLGSLLQTAALSTAALLVAAGPAAAQRSGGGHGGGSGYHGGRAYHGGGYYGGRVHAGGYYGDRYSSYYRHFGYDGRSGYYPGFYGSAIGFYPNYDDWGYDYPRFDYGVAVPEDYVRQGNAALYHSFCPPADGELAASRAAPPSDSKALLLVVVPTDAEIWVDNTKTTTEGNMRAFESPPLSAGTNYVYKVRARWTANGKEVDQTRTVAVRAGASLTVDFTRPAPSS
jgi:uncharacterized protein (TIGR03000 family)